MPVGEQGYGLPRDALDPKGVSPGRQVWTVLLDGANREDQDCALARTTAKLIPIKLGEERRFTHAASRGAGTGTKVPTAPCSDCTTFGAKRCSHSMAIAARRTFSTPAASARCSMCLPAG